MDEGNRERVRKITFWNVAGIERKEKEFWEELKEWDIMVLTETWLEEKGWGNIKKRLPKGYEWGVQHGKRKGKK